MRRVAGRTVLAAMVFVVAACGSPGGSIGPSAATSPAPSASADATLQPSLNPVPSVSPTFTAPPVAIPSPGPNPCSMRPYTGPWSMDPLGPSAVVRVAVAELNLRDGPCTDANGIGIIKKGTLLIVYDQPFGPWKGNGLPWYLVLVAPNVGPAPGQLPVLPGSPFPDGIDTDVGWVAVSDGERSFVEPTAPRCPTTVDLENVVGMLPSEWLACFDGPIVLEGTYGCGGCGGAGGPIGEPAWLADTFEFQQIRVRWGDGYEPVGLHFPPSGPAAPTEGSIIRVTVHVDDPAAAGCTFMWGIEDPPFAVPESMAVAWCRERLVVESYEVLGTDPNYPGG